MPKRWGSFALLLCLLGSVLPALAQRAAAQTGSQNSAYAVSGVTVGAPVQFRSLAYREYKCAPSDQYEGFTWCQKTRKEKERRGSFNATYSILHSRDGSVIYVNRYQEPAFFGANEADNDIQQYSRKIGESPRIAKMPHRAGFPAGILAAWGKVELDPLDNDSIKAFVDGRRPTIKGYYVDFIGDFARSAKEGLPIYRLSGGTGFVWVASYDQKGRGILRLTAVDASALAPPTTPKPAIETLETPTAQATITVDSSLPGKQAETELAANKLIDAESARDDAEKARDEAVRAKTDIEKAATAERATINAVIAQLQAEKEAAEAKARAIESVANIAIIGLISIIGLMVLGALIAFASMVRRRKTRTAAHHPALGPEPSEPELTEPAVVIKAAPEPTDGSKAAATKHPSAVGTTALKTAEPAAVTQIESASAASSETTAADHPSFGPEGELAPKEPAGLVETEPEQSGGLKATIEHPLLGREIREQAELNKPAIATTADSQTSGLPRPESKDSSSVAPSLLQSAEVSASLRPKLTLRKMVTGTLSAAAVGTLLYSKALNQYESGDTSRTAEATKIAWELRVEKSDRIGSTEAFVAGWLENEDGALAQIIGRCANGGMNFKATVLGRDGEPTVELPWDKKLEDYRTEMGRFMEVVYLPITLKVDDDEPQVVKRLHEEPYRNVIRLATLLSQPTLDSNHRQSRRETKTVSVQIDNLLSTEEMSALTSHYPDKPVKISEAKHISVQFDTSKGAIRIRIMMDDPAVQKLVELCQNQ